MNQEKIGKFIAECRKVMWVQEMNNIQNCIDEVIRKKVIEL